MISILSKRARHGILAYALIIYMFLLIMLPGDLQMIGSTVLILIGAVLMIRKAIQGGNIWSIVVSSALSAGMLYCIYHYWMTL